MAAGDIADSSDVSGRFEYRAQDAEPAFHQGSSISGGSIPEGLNPPFADGLYARFAQATIRDNVNGP